MKETGAGRRRKLPIFSQLLSVRARVNPGGGCLPALNCWVKLQPLKGSRALNRMFLIHDIRIMSPPS